ncbi:hypothetical protein ANCCAN_07258 [Ancylostoma caninum]|uniref:Uncharacterized protein n=1 Tax=Ancylostoma caninum TaxID=29170 RepID=A0A368GUJ6_ANCCA|nr:hypothetical protein ANCCAN_07258 [Ancylostoma caninum]
MTKNSASKPGKSRTSTAPADSSRTSSSSFVRTHQPKEEENGTLPTSNRRADVQFGVDLVSTYARYNTSILIDTTDRSFQTFDVEAMIREISSISDHGTPLYRALCGNVALAFSHNSLAEELESLKKTVKQLEAKLHEALQSQMEENGRHEPHNGDSESHEEIGEAEDEEPANPHGQNQVEAENAANAPNSGAGANAVFGQFPCPTEPFKLKKENKCRGVNLNGVYLKLTDEFRKYKRDYGKFFKQFAHNVCKEGYIEDDWKLLRVPNERSYPKMIDIDYLTIVDFVKATYEAGGQPVYDGFEADKKEELNKIMEQFRSSARKAEEHKAKEEEKKRKAVATATTLPPSN